MSKPTPYRAAPHPGMTRVQRRRAPSPAPHEQPPEPEDEEIHVNALDPRRHLIRMPVLAFLQNRFPWERE